MLASIGDALHPILGKVQPRRQMSTANMTNSFQICPHLLATRRQTHIIEPSCTWPYKVRLAIINNGQDSTTLAADVSASKLYGTYEFNCIIVGLWFLPCKISFIHRYPSHVGPTRHFSAQVAIAVLQLGRSSHCNFVSTRPAGTPSIPGCCWLWLCVVWKSILPGASII